MIQTTKHTSGPWFIGTPASNFQKGKKEIRSQETRQLICTLGRANLVQEEEANARLIAAAPETATECDRLKVVNAELLEALRNILETANAESTSALRSETWSPKLIAEKARAALIDAKLLPAGGE